MRKLQRTRVRTVSQFVNATDNLYEGIKAYERISDLRKIQRGMVNIVGKVSNMSWLYGKLRQGYTIIDIGIDSTRMARSASYRLEKIGITVWKTRNIWKFLLAI